MVESERTRRGGAGKACAHRDGMAWMNECARASQKLPEVTVRKNRIPFNSTLFLYKSQVKPNNYPGGITTSEVKD
jgi:hypothetical protein